VSSRPRDKREIKAITFILGGVFGGLYIAAALTMTAVNASEMKLAEERSAVFKQEREQFARELYDAELEERAEKIMPILEGGVMTYAERAEALQKLELEFVANQELASEEAERLTNLSATCGGE
jgi:hypothetical protein